MSADEPIIKDEHSDIPQQQEQPQPQVPQQVLLVSGGGNKNCKLHIGNLPVDIAEETLRKAFSKFGTIREVKVIRKNSQGQLLKEYCYGFVLMADSASAEKAIAGMQENQQNWMVAFSKDKVSEHNESQSGKEKKSSPSKKKDKKKEKENKEKKTKEKEKDKEEKEKEKSKDKEKAKKEKEKEKEKEKRKQRCNNINKISKKKRSKSKSSSSSSSSSSKSRSRSRKQQQKKKRVGNKRGRSSSGSSTSDYVPKHSVLVPVQQGLENPDKLMNMLFMQPEELQQMINQPQNQNPIRVHIHVRELFISGIPSHKTQQDLQKIMQIFGTIEKVDVIPKQLVNYAYVKYKLLESAYKAFEQASTIGSLLDSAGQVKVYFSDPFRRNQIVGNADDSEKDEDLLPILFIGYPSNPNLVIDENLLRKLAEKYGGPLKAMEHRKNDPQLRTYVLLEFYTTQSAKKAKKRFLRHKVQTLGDKKCDVALLSNLPTSLLQSQYQIRAPTSGVPQPVTHQRPFYPQQQPNPYPVPTQQNQQIYVPNQYRPPSQQVFQSQPIMGPPSYQQPIVLPNQPQTFYQQTTPQQFRPSQNFPQPSTTQPTGKQTTPQHVPPNLQTPPQQYYQGTQPSNYSYQQSTHIEPPYFQQQQQQHYYPPPTTFPQTQQTTQQATQRSQTNTQQYPYYQQYGKPPQGQNDLLMYPTNYIGDEQKQSTQQTTSNQKNQIIFIVPDYPQPQQPPQQTQQTTQNGQHQQNEQVFWSGFMMRGKQNRLGIDARIIHSPDQRNLNLPYFLHVNYKASIQDALNKATSPVSTLLLLTPSDETQIQQFDEYVRYFREKNRAGVIHQGEEVVIYIIPPGIRELSRIYNATEREMIAVYWPK